MPSFRLSIKSVSGSGLGLSGRFIKEIWGTNNFNSVPFMFSFASAEIFHQWPWVKQTIQIWLPYSGSAGEFSRNEISLLLMLNDCKACSTRTLSLAAEIEFNLVCRIRELNVSNSSLELIKSKFPLSKATFGSTFRRYCTNCLCAPSIHPDRQVFRFRATTNAKQLHRPLRCSMHNSKTQVTTSWGTSICFQAQNFIPFPMTITVWSYKIFQRRETL